MPVYRCAWLLPISQPPVRDGWVSTDGGRIVAFGARKRGSGVAADEIDLGDVALMPGLVNAHTHLELSWMRAQVQPGASFPDWIRSVMALRARRAPDDEHIVRSIETAVDEARRCGTALVGDVSNTLASSPVLKERGMPALVFHELLGFRGGDASAIVARSQAALSEMADTDLLRHSVSPHAPYSVSPALFQAIQRILNQDPFARSTVHLGESEAEIEFLEAGTGPFRSLLGDAGVWDPDWIAPACGPVEFLDRMGLFDERVLIVHGVHVGGSELRQIVARRATIVTCPRGNRLTGAGSPPVERFFEAGARVALGTDSLASVPDLNLFTELAELRELAPQVPARRLLESATVRGAQGLGFEADLGTIEVGKRDRLITVRIDRQEPDVEECLVRGIDASRIGWLP